MYEWFTAVLSHSAGSTAVMDASFLHLATYYAISGRNLVQLKSRAARTVVQSLRGRRRGMATWPTTSASQGGIHEEQQEQGSCIGRRKYFGWVYGVRIRTFVWYQNVRLRSTSDRDSLVWETSIPFSRIRIQDSESPSIQSIKTLHNTVCLAPHKVTLRS